jgi:hypothetical protein
MVISDLDAALDDEEQWRSPLSQSGDTKASSPGRDVLEAIVVDPRHQGRAPL